ncbi:DUF4325 domain-containing protein [Candidatus Saccharibacteria bacterium]|nr:DUF4325 domain-containing protein [Candidatus Saccharibacteria bacterium]
MAQLFPILGVTGPDLLLRDYGRRAFALLEEKLLQVSVGQALVLDFRGVSVMDTSFADETVLELAMGLNEGRYGDRFLILDSPSPATVDNIEGTIARRRVKIAMLVRDADGIRLVGHVEPNLAEVWKMTLHTTTLTARGLADQLGLQLNTASTRLHKLYNARLLARTEEITSAGRQHIYTLPGN